MKANPLKEDELFSFKRFMYGFISYFVSTYVSNHLVIHGAVIRRNVLLIRIS